MAAKFVALFENILHILAFKVCLLVCFAPSVLGRWRALACSAIYNYISLGRRLKSKTLGLAPVLQMLWCGGSDGGGSTRLHVPWEPDIIDSRITFRAATENRDRLRYHEPSRSYMPATSFAVNKAPTVHCVQCSE